MIVKPFGISERKIANAHVPRERYYGTFSMVARCAQTGELGVCVSTAVPAVGSVVPHVELGVAAIATQATTNVMYGIRGLQLLRLGLSPETVLTALLAEDDKREVRQVSIIDSLGRNVAHTGTDAVEWKGHLLGRNYVVAGNMLVGPQVIQAMAGRFESSESSLEDRLIAVLEAGQAAGGDKRGRVSAALLVKKINPERKLRPYIDLRVDDHPDPVRELRRIFDAYKTRYFPPHNQ